MKNINTMDSGINSGAKDSDSDNFSGHLLRTIPDGVAVYLKDRILFLNEQACDILKIDSLDDACNKIFSDFIHDGSASLWSEQLQTAQDSPGKTFEMSEYKFVSESHDIIDAEACTSSFKFNGAAAYITIFRDTGKRKFVETEINKFTLAVNHNPAVIILTDKDGIIEYVNPQFTEETGFTMEEAVGKTPRILKSGITPDHTYTNLWNTILSGKKWNGEFHNKKKSGEFFWEKASISPIFDSRGRISKFLAIKENITELKKLERLKQDTEQLLRHDLINMLNGIMGITHLFQVSQNVSKENILSWSEAIIKNGNKMLDVINNSFDFYKMEIGTYIRKESAVNLIRLFEELDREFTEKLELKSLVLIFQINGKMAKWNESFIVLGEYVHLKTLFTNLIKNAIEASPDFNKVTIDITQNEASQCEIIIHNYGTIPESLHNNFFDRYSTTGKTGGTGIGTYSAFLIAKSHGGDISFTTSEKDGTALKVMLPLSSQDAAS